MKIDDLFPVTGEGSLAHALSEKYVREQVHPHLPLKILNYTERCQYDRVWTPVTMACRGLIYNTETRDIVARPFDKFFNYGEEDVAPSYYHSPVTVTDKYDGSLGILYPTGWTDGRVPYAIATRRSFTSDQAIHATALLEDRYVNRGWCPDPGSTYLFEILYAANRIVCDYGDMDDLVLLGQRDIEYGYTTGPFETSWPGPRATTFDCYTFQDAIEMQPRPGAEGIVVHFHDLDKRLKIKQADYVELHRIVTGMNPRVVWERIGRGETMADICVGLPDEFRPWVETVAADLTEKKNRIIGAVLDEHITIVEALSEEVGNGDDDLDLPPDDIRRTGWQRPDFARKAVKSKYSSLLFLMLDGKDIAAPIWKGLRPAGASPMFGRGEDVA